MLCMILALCVMAKNEEKVIGRLIDSVAGHVDKVILSDTGSTDRTIEVATEACARNSLGLEIEEVEWVDFAHNRSSAMKFAEGKADYVLIGDADETFTFNGFDKDALEKDAYYLHYTGGEFYRNILLVRNNIGWYYEGRTHEAIKSDNLETAASLDTVIVTHHEDGGSRSNKYERDLVLLQQDLDDDFHPERTTFYMAQTYEGLDDFEKAAEWYTKRAEMGGWEEERWLAQMRAAKLSRDFDGCLEAWSARPHRLEPLYYAAHIAGAHEDWPMMEMLSRHGLGVVVEGRVKMNDFLFVEKWIYEIGFLVCNFVARIKQGLPVYDISDKVPRDSKHWNHIERVAKHYEIDLHKMLGTDAA